MKYIMIISMLLISSSVLAADEEKIEVPKAFKNSEIERKLENGQIQKFDGDEYEIVKRHKKVVVKPKPKPAPVVCELPKTVVKEVEVEKTVEVIKYAEPNRNRVSLLAGDGPRDGLNRSEYPASTTVESRTGAVGGVQYQRLFPLLEDRLSGGVQLLTNKTWMLELGLDF